MSTFVLNRDYVLRTLSGLSVRFVKGEPVFVPPTIQADAVAIGAVCVDGEVDVLPKEEDEEAPLTPDELKILMFAAFDQLVKRDGRGDFTGNGLPSMKAVEQIVGRNLDRADVTDAWREYQQSKS
jgi:hypothetical protein